MTTRFYNLTSVYFLTTILIGMQFTSETLSAQSKNPLVRHAVNEVDTAQLGKYNEILKE